MPKQSYQAPKKPAAETNPWAVAGSGSFPAGFTQKKQQDSYDYDPGTVSEFDAGEQYEYMPRPPKDKAEPNPWAVPGSAGIKVPKSFVQNRLNSRTRDTYDRDPDTVSQYDD